MALPIKSNKQGHVRKSNEENALGYSQSTVAKNYKKWTLWVCNTLFLDWFAKSGCEASRKLFAFERRADLIMVLILNGYKIASDVRQALMNMNSYIGINLSSIIAEIEYKLPDDLEEYVEVLKLGDRHDQERKMLKICKQFNRTDLIDNFVHEEIYMAVRDGNLPLLHEIVNDSTPQCPDDLLSNLFGAKRKDFCRYPSYFKDALKFLYDVNYIPHTVLACNEAIGRKSTLSLFFDDPNFDVEPILEVVRNFISDVTSIEKEDGSISSKYIGWIVTHPRYVVSDVVIKKHLQLAVDFSNQCDDNNDREYPYEQSLIGMLKSDRYKKYFLQYFKDKLDPMGKDDDGYHTRRPGLLGL